MVTWCATVGQCGYAYGICDRITSDNTRTINNLAIYVHKAFKVRNTAIFAGNNTQ